MRKLLVIALVLGMVGVASAIDVGNVAPTMGVKESPVGPVNVPNPMLQGGDTILTATVIPSLPYTDTGTTTGYNNDYSGSCIGSGAPDVVYSYVAAASGSIDVSLCGSLYDTGLYVFNASLVELGCNDDACGLQSELTQIPVVAGQTYYIFVDGYSAGNGAYTLNVEAYVPCVITCSGFAEGENGVGPGYVDRVNGGCNSTPPVFQFAVADQFGNLTWCGGTGWYVNAGGLQSRDTDWIALTVGTAGSIEFEYDGEQILQFLEIGSGINCPASGVVAGPNAGPCNPRTYTMTGAPGSTKVMWCGPATFPASPTNLNWDYIVHLSGLQPGPVATEATTWGTLKALYQ